MVAFDAELLGGADVCLRSESAYSSWLRVDAHFPGIGRCASFLQYVPSENPAVRFSPEFVKRKINMALTSKSKGELVHKKKKKKKKKMGSKIGDYCAIVVS